MLQPTEFALPSTHYYPTHGPGSIETAMFPVQSTSSSNQKVEHAGDAKPSVLAWGGQNGQEAMESWQLSELAEPTASQLDSKPDNEILEKEDELEMKDHGHLHLVLLLLQATVLLHDTSWQVVVVRDVFLPRLKFVFALEDVQRQGGEDFV